MSSQVYAPPSMPQSDRDSWVGTFKLVLRKQAQATDDMLPAVVLSYNRTTNRAKVQPLIVLVTTDNKQVQRGPVASVPVLTLGGGGFVASWPVKPGDLGWIKSNDRDISLFKQFYKQAPPNTERLHSFEDAMFIPDVMMKNVTIAGEDADNLVIQNLAGTVKMAWWSTFIKLIGRFGIGISPHSSAIFHIGSTTKASIPWPLMSLSQRNAIPSPQEGMAVWVTDTHYLSVYNGTTWS